MAFIVKQKNNNICKSDYSIKNTICYSNLQKLNKNRKDIANSETGVKKKYLSQCLTQASNSNYFNEQHKQSQTPKQCEILMKQFLSSYKEQQKSLFLHPNKQIQQYQSHKIYNKKLSKQENNSQYQKINRIKKEQKRLSKKQSPSKYAQTFSIKQNKQISKSKLTQSLNKLSQSSQTKIQKVDLRKLISKSKSQWKKQYQSPSKNTQKHRFQQPCIHVEEFNVNKQKQFHKIKQKHQKVTQNCNKNQFFQQKIRSFSKDRQNQLLKKKVKFTNCKQNKKNPITIDIQLDEILIEDSHCLIKHQNFKKKQKFIISNQKIQKPQKSSSRSKSKQNKLLKSFNKGKNTRQTLNKKKKTEVQQSEDKYSVFTAKKLQTNENDKRKTIQSTIENSEKNKYEFSYNIVQNEKYGKFGRAQKCMSCNKKEMNQFINENEILNLKQENVKLKQGQFIRQIKDDLEKLMNKINVHSYAENK